MRSAGKIGIVTFMLAGQLLVAAAFAQSPDDNRIRCKTETQTASRMQASRVCRTAAQWRQIEAQRELDQKASGENLRRELVESAPRSVPSPQ
jgi:hypothetical protein